MKKAAVMLFALTMGLLVLVGCGGKDKDKTKDPSDEKDSITVNTDVKGSITVGINANFNTDFEVAVEAFQKQYPNVEIQPIVYESKSDDALEYLTSQEMGGKKKPDIIYHDAGPLPSYIQNGWVYPLTSFVEGDEAFEKVPKNLVDNYMYNDNLYALGYTIFTNALLINEDLVEEMNVDLPEYDWNWDDFQEFVKACTSSTCSGVEDLTEAYNWMPGTMTEGRSITGYDYTSNSFDLEAVRKYVNYYSEIGKLNGVEGTSLKQIASAGKSDYEKKFGTGTEKDAAFIAGKMASTFTGTWAYATWNQKELDFNWELYPVPQCTPGRIPIHVDYCWMTTDVADENLEAAWTFLRYVTYSREGNLARLTAYDEDHISDDVNQAYYIPWTNDEEVVEKFRSLPYVTDPILYIFDNLDKGYLGDPEKTVPGFEDVDYSVVGKLAHEAVMGKRDFASGMNEAQSKANAQIQEHLTNFNAALAKFEAEFAATHK